jgi:hypothetical protein
MAVKEESADLESPDRDSHRAQQTEKTPASDGSGSRPHLSGVRKEEEETSWHFLSTCEALGRLRQNIFGSPEIQEEDAGALEWNDILTFFIKVGKVQRWARWLRWMGEFYRG